MNGLVKLKTPLRILITDANNRVALELTRSLGCLGHHVDVCEQETFAGAGILSASSRWARQSHVVSAFRSEEQSLSELAGLFRRYDLVLPVAINTILLLVDQPEITANCTHQPLLPPSGMLRRINDTSELERIAVDCDVPFPETLRIEPGSPMLLEPPKGNRWIVKLANDEGLYLPPGLRYRTADSIESLNDGLRILSKYKKTLLVQEHLAGLGWGYSAIFGRDSTPVAEICHVRRREYPASGGPSSCCRSLWNSELIDYGRRILAHARWVGPAMVEFKVCPETNRIGLLEVNPRFWGSLPLGRAAGVNFGEAYLSALLNIPVCCRQARNGATLRFLFQDLAGVIQYVRRGPSGLLRAAQAITDLFDLSVTEGLNPISDPRPGIVYLKQRLNGHSDGEAP